MVEGKGLGLIFGLNRKIEALGGKKLKVESQNRKRY